MLRPRDLSENGFLSGSEYPNVIKVGYCSLQTLLKFRSPNAYTASKTYGWRADIYEITPNTVIVTGYAPFGNIVPDYETVKKYEEKAKELCEKYQQPQEKVYRELGRLGRSGHPPILRLHEKGKHEKISSGVAEARS